MLHREVVAFLDPHLKQLGLPPKDILEIRFMPHGWEVDYAYRDGIGIIYNEASQGPLMDTLFIKYDDNVYNAFPARKP